MRRVPVADLTDFGVRFLTSKGVPEAAAKCVAEVVVKTEACGISTHGLAVFGYLAGNLGTEINPAAEPSVIRETAAMALIDGNSGIGQLAMKLAVEIAADKAAAQGVAMVGVRNASWLGALGVHLMPLAERGLLAQLWAQTSTCKDCAPYGGIDARFSTNPVALAFPTGGDPVIADVSTAVMSLGKAYQLIRAGEKANERAFLDRDGDLTDDPNVMEHEGTMLFLGGEHFGHKGYGLSLWCEALTALVGGDCNNPEAKTRQSFHLTVASPATFSGAESYDKEIKRFVAHVMSSRVRPGFERIRLPGERAYKAMRDAAENGIALDDARIEQLQSIAKTCNIRGIPE